MASALEPRNVKNELTLENWPILERREAITLWNRLITTTQTHFNVVKFTQLAFLAEKGSLTKEFVAPIDQEIWSLQCIFNLKTFYESQMD